MRSKTDLYQLIKSLSKAEKRYFTLDAKKSGRENSRYLQLFQAIVKMEAYDETPLKQEFGKKLSDDKARLYEAILRAMRDYRSVHSKSARIQEMILDAKFLYERGLYHQWEERLKGAKSLAEELEDYLALLDINREERLVKNSKLVQNAIPNLDALIQEKERVLQLLQEELSFMDTYNTLWHKVIRAPKSHSAEDKTALLKSYEQQLEENRIPEGLQAKLRYFQSKALIAQFSKDHLEANRHYNALMETWDLYPSIKDEEFHRYIVHASNQLHILAQSSELVQYFPAVLEKLEQEQPTSLHDQAVLFHRTASFRLFYYINFGKDANLSLVLRPIERGLKKYALPVSAELLICFNAGFLMFLGEDYAESQKWLNRVIINRDAEQRTDLSIGARLIDLVITVERDEVELWDNKLRSIQRYLLRQPASTLKKFTLTFIGLLKRYFTAPLSEERDRLIELIDFLEVVQKDTQRPPLGLDELFTAWAKSRRLGKKIREVLA